MTANQGVDKARRAAHLSGQPATTNGSRTLRELTGEAVRGYCRTRDGHGPTGLYGMVVTEVESALLESVMDYAGGNQTRAARMLGIDRGTLRTKLRRHSL
ncbi:MAG: Fis family transcriptional regulator [Gammaproteobacteria bacterium]|nr:Fis family transcriptional regulator [Gammaproteobacteria bacterium]